MGRLSSIEWTHHTFNPWWGCVKVSSACDNCYAESWAKRVGQAVWGSGASRRFFGEAHWREPIRWNKEAQSLNQRQRVFCASMADVFEARKDLASERERLWDLIKKTPALDWLLLTKRPQNISRLCPWASSGEWPANLWLGTTIENQAVAKKRLPHLLKHRSVVRFLSCEPLLGPLDLSEIQDEAENSIDWIIAGGESGHHARPMNPAWVRKLRDFARKNAIAFHFKQWGHWAPSVTNSQKESRIITIDGHRMAAIGKLKAGRLLDGQTWDGLPARKAA